MTGTKHEPEVFDDSPCDKPVYKWERLGTPYPERFWLSTGDIVLVVYVYGTYGTWEAKVASGYEDPAPFADGKTVEPVDAETLCRLAVEGAAKALHEIADDLLTAEF